MRLALFDLDHTLIPFDSGLAFTAHLCARGLLPADAEPRHLAACRRFVAGEIDIRGLHRESVAPLAGFDAARIAACAADFAASLAPRLPPDTVALVRRHSGAGAACVLVTATARFIAEPLARAFGVSQVIATESAWRAGRLTGDVDGEPCHGDAKRARVQAWLDGRPAHDVGWHDAWFYSDSASDLPLLRAVSNPVAVAPDARLRAEAARLGWPIVERGQAA